MFCHRPNKPVIPISPSTKISLITFYRNTRSFYQNCMMPGGRSYVHTLFMTQKMVPNFCETTRGQSGEDAWLQPWLWLVYCSHHRWHSTQCQWAPWGTCIYHWQWGSWQWAWELKKKKNQGATKVKTVADTTHCCQQNDSWLGPLNDYLPPPLLHGCSRTWIC